MNQVFHEYKDATVASGVVAWKPSIGDHLRSTKKRFDELASSANVELGTEETIFTTTRSSPKSSSSPDSVDLVTSSQGFNVHGTRRVSVPETISQPTEPVSMLGYQFTYEDVPSSIVTGVLDDTQQNVRKDDNSLYITPRDGTRHGHAVPPTPSYTEDWRSTVDRSLKPAHTYSFQETTFARRLIRDSYEKVYFLLTNPKTPPELVEHKFRYSFCFNNVDSIIRRAKDIIDRSNQEPLGNWEFPMLHVGGAGLHFPRDEGKEVEPPQGWLSQRNVGPWPIHHAKTRIPVEDFPENVMKWSNLEGIWFDNHDVEMYLRTKGLYLDGSSSVAEIEVEDTDPPMMVDALTHSPNSTLLTVDTSGPHSPANTNGNPSLSSSSVDHSWQNATASESAMDTRVGLDFTLLEDNDYSQKSLELLNQQPKDMNEDIFIPYAPPQRRKIMIDVDKLLNGE